MPQRLKKALFHRAALLLSEIWISPPSFLQDSLVSEKLRAMYLFSSKQESFEQTLSDLILLAA